MALDFFTQDRTNFFRPLTWDRRELIAACLKALYETLYGPGAGQAAPMTRERLRILFIGVLRSRDWSQLVVARWNPRRHRRERWSVQFCENIQDTVALRKAGEREAALTGSGRIGGRGGERALEGA